MKDICLELILPRSIHVNLAWFIHFKLRFGSASLFCLFWLIISFRRDFALCWSLTDVFERWLGILQAQFFRAWRCIEILRRKIFRVCNNFSLTRVHRTVFQSRRAVLLAFLIQNLKHGNFNFLFITFLDYAIPSYYYKNKNDIFCENKVVLHGDK